MASISLGDTKAPLVQFRTRPSHHTSLVNSCLHIRLLMLCEEQFLGLENLCRYSSFLVQRLILLCCAFAFFINPIQVALDGFRLSHLKTSSRSPALSPSPSYLTSSKNQPTQISFERRSWEDRATLRSFCLQVFCILLNAISESVLAGSINLGDACTLGSIFSCRKLLNHDLPCSEVLKQIFTSAVKVSNQFFFYYLYFSLRAKVCGKRSTVCTKGESK